ncbi:MAG TPA: sn-glycerol-3-phosphate ABC transporter ATP-binding protein UgpC [Mycobacteriales bacterium]|nr:sn-glycerol-3-phosphate ABC transporter ATP-binding protein UgpC [Mycobacteriales bacterium]
MAPITIDRVGKVYPNGYEAIRELSLDVAEGEFMVLVGPSGCGKTTALRMVAGLEEITSGTLRIGDRVVNNVTSKDRDVAMVFQNYALYPHMTVAENIAFALKLRRVPRAETQRKVVEAAAILGLTEWMDRKPGQLSGGQRQRVAMGRAIVRDPAVFLMDEPLSNLDAKLRVQMRSEVSRIQRRIGVATLYVTHDQTEAMTMGDRVAVLRSGTLQQCDHPQTLYDWPNNLFVAAFIGSPAMNLFEAVLSPDASSVTIGSQQIALPEQVHRARPGVRAYGGRGVVVGIRPEDLPAADGAAPGSHTLRAEAVLVEALGSELLVHFSIDAERVHVDSAQDNPNDELDDSGELAVRGEGIARVQPRLRIRAGDRTEFLVHAERMHFFDRETQQAIVR